MIGYVTIGALDSEASGKFYDAVMEACGNERKFADGGWVYLNLVSDPTALGITATAIQSYAARIPQIDNPRQLFAALLFPVIPTLGDVSA